MWNFFARASSPVRLVGHALLLGLAGIGGLKAFADARGLPDLGVLVPGAVMGGCAGVTRNLSVNPASPGGVVERFEDMRLRSGVRFDAFTQATL